MPEINQEKQSAEKWTTSTNEEWFVLPLYSGTVVSQTTDGHQLLVNVKSLGRITTHEFNRKDFI